MTIRPSPFLIKKSIMADVVKSGVDTVNVLKIIGVDATVGTPVVSVRRLSHDGFVDYAKGATTPTNGDAGYAVGCIFINTVGGAGATGYINEGTTTSASFALMSGVLATNPNIVGNETWTKEVNHTSTVTATTTAATAGGSLSFAAGAGNTSGTGGAISVTGGAGGTSGTGGSASLVGGASGGVNGLGGAALVTGGAGIGSGNGGAVTVTAGLAGVTGVGGAVLITAGAGGATSGNGGAASLVAGAATASNSTGGAAAVTGGLGKGTSAGGAVTLTSGAASNGTAVNPGASGAINLTVGAAGTATTGTAGAGGAINLTGAAGGASTGASSTAGAGSIVTITAGAGGASSGGADQAGAGGDLVFVSGAAGAGATAGRAGGSIFRAGILCKPQGTPTAATTSALLTAANILTGIITINQGGAGASAQQLPNGTNLAAALPASFTTGDSFDVAFVNISTVAAEVASVTTNTGMTLVGSMDIQAHATATTCGSSALLRFRMTGATTFSVYRIA